MSSGALLRGPGGSGEGTVCGHSSCTSLWSWLLSPQLLVPPGSEGFPPPAPALCTASQTHLEPLAAPFLAAGALSKPSWGSSLAFPAPLTGNERTVAGGMQGGSWMLPFMFLAQHPCTGEPKGFAP